MGMSRAFDLPGFHIAPTSNGKDQVVGGRAILLSVLYW